MKSILFVMTLLVGTYAHAFEQVVLSCNGPMHAEIQSVFVTADMALATDDATMSIYFIDGHLSQFPITKEDVVEGYIELPAYNGLERVLTLDDNGWSVVVFNKTTTETTKVDCTEF